MASIHKVKGVIHKWDVKIVHVSSVIMAEKEKNESNVEENALNLLHGS